MIDTQHPIPSPVGAALVAAHGRPQGAPLQWHKDVDARKKSGHNGGQPLALRTQPRQQLERVIVQDFADICVAEPALRTVPIGSRSAGGNE